ncbi:MAG: hypothetical protein ACK5AO_08105, partial [bacterium]
MRSLFIIVVLCCVSPLQSQVWLTGRVYDSTRMVSIGAVKVASNKGQVAYTDSTGRYGISVDKTDSVVFTYMGRSTTSFPVKDIKYPAGFDISLQIRVNDKYQTLKEVVIIGKSYREDSMENREKYRKVFEFEGGGLQFSGASGNIDPNSVINSFKFRKNKVMRSFQNRLIKEEQEKFVDNRFNKALVKQITGFENQELERFMRLWRPPYEFVAMREDYEFYQYILDASKY